MSSIKSIAIHLPQFHPFKENDEWWGQGFTEWTNVTKSTPRFEGHYQPHLPADLGFYDLRLEEARMAQEALAKEYGIYGFCYYHYWFNGKRLMEQPLERKLQNKKEDLPFMLCWANENWTRAWDGQDREVLIKQDYSLQDDETHMHYLFKNVFCDDRYIRVNNAILFAVYRPVNFPDIEATVNLWREIAAGYGEELHLVYMRHFTADDKNLDVIFDGSIDFQPNFKYLPESKIPSKLERLRSKFTNEKLYLWENRVIEYKDLVKTQMEHQTFTANIFPGITPMWDNSARRKKDALVIHGSTPKIYREWLDFIISSYKKVETSKDKFVFINAWNEWAEGNHLEPCQKWGKAYLEETKKAFEI